MTRLRTVERFYVKAQKIDWPHSTKLIGPFDSRAESWAKYEQLRDTKTYPDCSMTMLSKRVPLAQAHPKGS